MHAQRITPEIHSQIEARCRRVFFALGWRYPFFYPAISYLTFRAGYVGTACVRLDGQITVDPRFADQLSDDELAFVIAHEVSHLLYLHFARRGDRDLRKWNIAGDRALNAILKDAGILPLQGALLPRSDQWTWTAEDLYNAEPDPPQHEGPEPRPGPGQGCGVDPAPSQGGGQGADESDDDSDGQGGGQGADESDDDSDGQGGGQGQDESDDDSDGQGGGQGQDDGSDGQGGQDGDKSGKSGQGENNERSVGDVDPDDNKVHEIPDWGYVAAQCAASAQNSGNEQGRVLRRLAESPPTRVRWDRILRRAVSAAMLRHGADDTTWKRRSRRSRIYGAQYPGTTAYRTRVCVMVDTSGSMGEKAVADAISNTVKIARTTGCRIFLVGHTGRAYFAEWLEGKQARTPALQEFLSASGGTSFVHAFQVIAAERAKFDALIQLTDGECYWPDPPKPRNCHKQIIALLGMAERSYAPKTAQVIEASI